MKSIFINIIDIQFGTSIAILLLVIFRAFMKSRYSASMRRILWLVIVLRLCIPIRADLQIKGLPGFRIPVEDYYIYQLPSSENTRVIPRQQGYKMEIAQREDYSIVSTPETNIVSMSDIAFYIWLSGVVFMASAVPAYFVSHKKIMKNSADNQFITEKLADMKKKTGVKQNVAAVVSNRVPGPVLMGILHPVIVLPAVRYTEQELEMILTHELIHLRSKDVVYKILLWFIKCIYWFNPLAWVMAEYARNDIEMACDEAVVHNTCSDYKADYAQSIVASAVKSRNRYIVGTNFTSGGSILKQRFENIFSEKAKKNSKAFMRCFFAFVIISTAVIGCGKTDRVKINKNRFPLPEEKVYEVLEAEDINWTTEYYYPDTTRQITLIAETNDVSEISTDRQQIEKGVHNTAGILEFFYRPEGEYVSLSGLNISGVDITDAKLKKAVAVLCRMYGIESEETVRADVLAFLQNNGEEYGAWYQDYDGTYAGVWYDTEIVSGNPDIDITIMDEKYFSVWSENIEKSMYYRSLLRKSNGIVFPRGQLPPVKEKVNEVIKGNNFSLKVTGQSGYNLSDYKNHYGYYGDIGDTFLTVYNISDDKHGSMFDLQIVYGDFGNKLTAEFNGKGCSTDSAEFKQAVKAVCQLYNNSIDENSIYSVFMGDLQQGMYNLDKGRLTWNRAVNGVYYSAVIHQDKNGVSAVSFSACDKMYSDNFFAMTEAQSAGVSYTIGETVQDIWNKGE